MQQLTITGYSTALFATWYFMDELDVLFDAGDGVVAGLLQKARKVKHVFISHADRDHLTGLLQFNQLNARPEGPIIYYPAHSGSFPAMAAFARQFDPHVAQVQWVPVMPGNDIPIKDGFVVNAVRNSHVQAPDSVIKSLSYNIWQVKRKLKPELLHLSGQEIRKISEERGEDSITNEVRENIISYSGDTPVEDYDRWKNTNVLIHEATFINQNHDGSQRNHAGKHSLLEEVVRMVSTTQVKRLVLGHFSSRYTNDEIEAAVKNLCDKYSLNIPVYCVLPGEIKRDILAGAPVNK